MRFWVLAALLLITLSFPLCADPAAAGSPGYGFWEIGVTNFSADPPIVVRSPLSDNNNFYYLWPITFKNTISMNRVLQAMQSRLQAAGDNPEKKELLTRCISRVKADIDRKRGLFHLYVSLHTDTGKVYQDLSDPLIRDLAQRKLRYKYYTTGELAARKVKPGELVRVVAIFPEIDSKSDAFEIRVLGLGQRMLPSYFPGSLINLNNQHEPRLRKSLSYFYKRPGDPLRRDSDPIIFDTRKEEWLWMWTTDIYPQKSGQFLVKRSQGLRYEYRYLPYEIFNSTPEEQRIKVLRAGLAPTVKWHGIPLSIPMTEAAGTDLVLQKQAVKVLRSEQPDLFASNSARQVDTTLQPGKKAAGIAIFRWGVEDAAALLNTVLTNLYLNNMDDSSQPQNNPLRQGYSTLKGKNQDTQWHYPPLPAKEAVKAMVLEQARKELAALGEKISPAAQRRYASLAPFAVLMNNLALQRITSLEKSGRIPVTFTVLLGKVKDAADFTSHFDIPAPPEQDIMPKIKIIDPERMVIEEAPPAKAEVAKPAKKEEAKAAGEKKKPAGEVAPPKTEEEW